MTIKEQIRTWLGIDKLPTRGHLNSLELAERNRHAEVIDLLARIEQQMQVEHIGRRKIVDRIDLDWDAVQMQALTQLEKENRE